MRMFDHPLSILYSLLFGCWLFDNRIVVEIFQCAYSLSCVVFVTQRIEYVHDSVFKHMPVELVSMGMSCLNEELERKD